MKFFNLQRWIYCLNLIFEEKKTIFSRFYQIRLYGRCLSLFVISFYPPVIDQGATCYCLGRNKLKKLTGRTFCCPNRPRNGAHEHLNTFKSAYSWFSGWARLFVCLSVCLKRLTNIIYILLIHGIKLNKTSYANIYGAHIMGEAVISVFHYFHCTSEVKQMWHM